ncbi:MAG: tRNA (5-methylaminomethyl-2-thiouridine)(34)-methyltransferase MnmD [Prevotellaceae bacterium]|nr:tRNA (5-methylaminomethyl-2-thiouridine)(34)-methyltransferase MnmD [Prevotellaceae bacterium]
MIQILTTNDGSHTIINEQFNETYHSERGAILESRHVFIEAGFQQVQKSQVAVFEVGFGTGLNAWLTLLEAEKTGQHVYYESIELYPIELSTSNALNFSTLTGSDFQRFPLLHLSEWNKPVAISPHFTLHKVNVNLLNYNPQQNFDVVYFDAFSPDTQPELWSKEVFDKIYKSLNNNGLLTTYSSKGLVKQNLRAAGFTVQRLQGAGGKRHMLRATASKQ